MASHLPPERLPTLTPLVNIDVTHTASELNGLPASMLGAGRGGLMPSFRMFVAAMTAASKIDPHLAQTKCNRLMARWIDRVTGAARLRGERRIDDDDAGAVPRRLRDAVAEGMTTPSFSRPFQRGQEKI